MVWHIIDGESPEYVDIGDDDGRVKNCDDDLCSCDGIAVVAGE